MKYCSNCGHPLEDDAHFCSSCGHRVADETREKGNDDNAGSDKWEYGKNVKNTKNGSTSPDRKGMRVWCWVFAVMGIVSIVMALTEDYSMMAMAAFCFPLAGMFFILSKTPKNSKYLFGAASGIRKSFFITACIVLAFVLFMILTDEYEVSEPAQEQDESFLEYEQSQGMYEAIRLNYWE